MILHLIDDEKFIDATIEHFENVLPGRHIYLILTSKVDLKYIKKKDKITFFSDLNIEASDFFQKEKIEFVFIHFLSDVKVDFVTTAKEKAHFNTIWFLWGADGFELPKFKGKLLQSKTSRLVNVVNKEPVQIRAIKGIIKYLANFNFFILDYQPKIKKRLNLIKNLNYIVPVIKQDYDLFISEYKTKAKYIEWNYLSIEQMLPLGLEYKISGNNILVGNSAHPSNNHIEIIDILEKYDLTNRKVIVPLSYGETSYREHIIKYGKEKLGVFFVPLTEFLPLDEYNSIIRSCGFVIMNQNRQQAMGNIICSIFMGAKVFLNNNCTMKSYFEEKNILFYSIKSLKNNCFELESPLPEDSKRKNREKIYSFWNKEAIAKKTKALIEIIYN